MPGFIEKMNLATTEERGMFAEGEKVRNPARYEVGEMIFKYEGAQKDSSQ